MLFDVVLAVFAALVLLFGFVLLFGAPYLPTLKPQSQQALDLLDLKPGQTMLELGCGDGRVLLAAAKRGITCVGWELNPLLALVARVVTWRYRRQVRVICGNYWQAKWPPAEGIYGFILAKYMAKLDKKIRRDCKKPVKLVSLAFEVPGRRADRRVSGLFLYKY